MVTTPAGRLTLLPALLMFMFTVVLRRVRQLATSGSHLCCTVSVIWVLNDFSKAVAVNLHVEVPVHFDGSDTRTSPAPAPGVALITSLLRGALFALRPLASAVIEIVSPLGLAAWVPVKEPVMKTPAG